MRQW
jgi:hypothetical protein